MNDRPMSLDQALAVLGGEIERDDHPSGRTCGVCGVPLQMAWSHDQIERHRRYHEAQAVAAGAR